MDNNLSIDDHGNKVCKAALFYIRALRHIRRCVSVDDVDSCDRVGVIPAGLLQLDTVRHLFIQPQQTTAFTQRTIAYRHDDKARDHTSPVLVRLHWLLLLSTFSSKSHC